MSARGSGKVAKRYARALFELGSLDASEAALRVLESFSKLVDDSHELREALGNPVVPMKEREEIVRALAERIGESADARNLLMLLLESGRFGELEGVAAALRAFIEHARRLRSLEVTSAFPIDSAEQSALRAEMERHFGAGTNVTWRVEPEILGGLRVKAGDLLLDGSVRGALERVRAQLIQ